MLDSRALVRSKRWFVRILSPTRQSDSPTANKQRLMWWNILKQKCTNIKSLLAKLIVLHQWTSFLSLSVTFILFALSQYTAFNYRSRRQNKCDGLSAIESNEEANIISFSLCCYFLWTWSSKCCFFLVANWWHPLTTGSCSSFLCGDTKV